MVSAVVLAIGISVSLYGASELQMGFGKNKSAQAFNYAEACLDEAVYKLKISWASASSTLSFDQGYCTMNATISGPQAEISATGTVQIQTDTYTRRAQMTINDNYEILDWSEN